MKGDVSTSVESLELPAQMMQSIGTCACFCIQAGSTAEATAGSTAEATEARWQSAPKWKMCRSTNVVMLEACSGPRPLESINFLCFLATKSDDFFPVTILMIL